MAMGGYCIWRMASVLLVGEMFQGVEGRLLWISTLSNLPPIIDTLNFIDSIFECSFSMPVVILAMSRDIASRVGDVLQNGNFFQELANSTSDLSDKHINASLYYFRKKYCYHGEHLSEKIKCTTIDTIFNGTVEIVKLFKKHGWFVENSSEEQMTNYARGLQISALTSWSYVDKILLPMRLSPTKQESESTHYALGVLDLSKKVIDLYDSISDKKYGRRSMALAKTNGRLLPDLLKALCLKDEHTSYGDDVKTFSVVRKEDVPKQPDEINDWRIELPANLWQHCMWKKETGYATPEENGYDDYGDNEVNMCPFDL
ncbi:hypothetical protein CQW23_18600 [Capsicum baccatum]|uniref:Ubiquitin-like protease family profile domain-containing protein n=1 Tax=Capsicum baccatum TaxID=33114 RepID=A0A2G2W3E2_CAPBA|nr:hypothetical protein CQW23_18600 [Capsicum baccatum]